MHQGVGKHNTVKQVFLLPLLLLAQVGVVHAGGDGGVGGHEGQSGGQAASGQGKAHDALAKLAPVRAAHADQGGVEGNNHAKDTEGNDLFHLGIDIFREIAVHDHRQHDGGADLPVQAGDQVHTRAGAGDIAHGEEQAGSEGGHADHAGGDGAVVLADGVNGGHAGHNGQTVGGHHKGDAHEDNGDHDPQQGVAIVGAQHGGGGDGAGADDNAGGNEAGTDSFDKVFQRQPFNIGAEDLIVFTH